MSSPRKHPFSVFSALSLKVCQGRAGTDTITDHARLNAPAPLLPADDVDDDEASLCAHFLRPLRTTFYSLLTTDYVRLTAYYLLPATHYLLVTIYYLLIPTFN